MSGISIGALPRQSPSTSLPTTLAPRKAQAIIKDPESQRKKRERDRKRKNGRKGKRESERDKKSVIEKYIGAGNEDRFRTGEEIEMGRSRSKKYGYDRKKKLCRRK